MMVMQLHCLENAGVDEVFYLVVVFPQVLKNKLMLKIKYVSCHCSIREVLFQILQRTAQVLLSQDGLCQPLSVT